MRNNKIPKQSLGCLRLVIFGLVDTSCSTGWTRILWISSTYWINFLSECQELAKIESTSGPFGGQSFTTFAVESCLSFQVNRSDVLDDSRQQYVTTPPETASETSTLPGSTFSLKNVTLFSWALLDCLVYFSFPSSLLYTCFHTFISWSCTVRKLPPCTSYF